MGLKLGSELFVHENVADTGQMSAKDMPQKKRHMA